MHIPPNPRSKAPRGWRRLCRLFAAPPLAAQKELLCNSFGHAVSKWTPRTLAPLSDAFTHEVHALKTCHRQLFAPPRDTHGLPNPLSKAPNGWRRLCRLFAAPPLAAQKELLCNSFGHAVSKWTPRSPNEKARHKVGLFRLVGAGGFGPPKALPADLQSVPFGHSGTLPYEII